LTTLRIRDTTIVTQDDARRVLHGDVFVEDGVVTHVGEVQGRKEADQTVDGRGQVLLPGLVNLHTHLAMTLLRGYGDDLPLEEWLSTRIWPAEDRIDADAMRAGVRLGLLEMVRGGTTSFLDMYWMEQDVLAPACREAGVRAWAGEGMVDFQTPEGEPNRKVALVEAWLRSWSREKDPLVTPCPAPHATYTARGETFRECGRLSREYGVPMHTHCGETRKEVYDVAAKTGRRPLAELAHHGALGPRAVLAHCGWTTKAEVDAIAAAGAAVAHCPVSNLKLATGGVAPVPELQHAGVRVGLGTDGAASNNTLSMWETMKLAAILHKHHRWEATAVPAQRALDMATRDGADALHRGDLGRIQPGATADLCLVDFRRPHLVPRHDTVSLLVYAASAADVSATIVGGRILMRDGRPTTLDPAAVLEEAQRQATRVASAPPHQA